MIVEAMMVVRAYSPYDPVDAEWRRNNPVPITARGNNCNDHPYGIAAYLPHYPKGTVISVPGYGDALVDDTGGDIRKAEVKWVEVRFPTHEEAKQWGVKTLKIRIKYP
jgi:3D (Asp-Asp-Asp) domain-containing protein